MKKLLGSILILLLLQGLAYSQALKIHTKDGIIYNFLISNIDSITFSDPNYIPSEGLIAYYAFDGNANDQSSFGNHGLSYGVEYVKDRFGNGNSAVSFNGIDNFIDLGNDGILKPEFPISISVWIKLNNIQNQSVFTNNYVEDSHYGFWLNTSSTGQVAISYGNGGIPDPSNRKTKIAQTILNPEQWYHVVGIIYSKEAMDIYIDGNNDGGEYSGTANAMTYNEGSANIGRKDSHVINPPLYLNGILDDLILYNRALSEEEILQIFNSFSN